MRRGAWLACAAMLMALRSTARALSDTEASGWKAKVAERLDAEEYETDAPLIGVLTQPSMRIEHEKVSGISGPVVSWIEAAGGRVVPIKYHASEKEIEETFSKVNGLFFPGGAATLWYGHQYFDAAALLYRLAIESNQAGTIFPLYGTCLGFEMLHILVANKTREALLYKSPGQEDNDNTIQLTRDAGDSLFFRGWPRDLLKRMGQARVRPTYNAHEWAVSPRAYDEFPALREALTILSTSKDGDGNEYVSTVEGKALPFFGSQWHPEKVPYEFDDEHVPHTRTAIQAGLYTAQLLVDIARLNPVKVPYQEQVRLVVQNYENRFVARHPELYSAQLPDTMWFVPWDDREDRDDGRHSRHSRRGRGGAEAAGVGAAAAGRRRRAGAAAAAA